MRESSAIAARACEWLGQWILRKAPPWRGPAVVAIYARMVVIALPNGEPIDYVANEGECYCLRIAAAELPPVTLHVELAQQEQRIVPIVHVPASLTLTRPFR
jgi:hypothetical protein